MMACQQGAPNEVSEVRSRRNGGDDIFLSNLHVSGVKNVRFDMGWIKAMFRRPMVEMFDLETGERIIDRKAAEKAGRLVGERLVERE